MVGMLDYNLHYASLEAEQRVRDAHREACSGQPIRPHRRPRILPRRSRGSK